MTQGPIGGFHEHDANSVIAEWLNDAGRHWQADAERTRTLISSKERPDIIIRQGEAGEHMTGPSGPTSSDYIPRWNNGILPAIDRNSPASRARSPYIVSPQRLIYRFGATAHRRYLLRSLFNYRAELYESGIEHGFQWIDGSFVQDVESFGDDPYSNASTGAIPRIPGDIDVVTFHYLPAGMNQREFMDKFPQLFDSEFIKATHSIDSYLTVLDPSNMNGVIRNVVYWYSLWSHTRSGVWKGYVEVPLNSDSDAIALSLLSEETEQGGTP